MVQCLHQSNVHIKRKSWPMESPKIYSSSRYKKCTYLCGSANYPVSCKAVYGRERKFVEIRAYLSPWCSVYTKAMLISKEKLGLCRAEKSIPLVGAKSALTCAGPQSTPSHVRQYTAEDGNLWKFRITFRNGAVFVPKQ